MAGVLIKKRNLGHNRNTGGKNLQTKEKAAKKKPGLHFSFMTCRDDQPTPRSSVQASHPEWTNIDAKTEDGESLAAGFSMASDYKHTSGQRCLQGMRKKKSSYWVKHPNLRAYLLQQLVLPNIGFN